jgi:ankyrin repeat protein
MLSQQQNLTNTSHLLLHRTARGSGQAAIRGKLLRGGADFNSVNKIGQTPLIYSCIEQHVAVAKLLLEVSCSSEGADVNLVNKIEQTPLIYSCIEQHVAVAKLLLEVSCSAGELMLIQPTKLNRHLSSTPA